MNPRAFVPLAIIAVFSCRQQPTAPTSVAGLTLDLAIAQTDLQHGQSDTITVTLTNTNSYSVDLTEGGCPLLFYIVDPRGVTVVPSGGSWVCIAVISRVTLAAGESQTRTFEWWTTPFAPGIYKAYGTFSGEGLKLQTPRMPVALK